MKNLELRNSDRRCEEPEGGAMTRIVAHRAHRGALMISSRKSFTRGSFDWPSQKIACLRVSTEYFELAATSISHLSFPSPRICDSEKRIFFAIDSPLLPSAEPAS